MRKTSVLGVVVLALALVSIAAAKQNNWNQNMPTGKAFINKAAEINLGEIALGRLAVEKSNDPAIRDFGNRMVQDHTQAEGELQTLAKKEGVTLPTKPGPAVSSLEQQLSSSSEQQFNKLYMDHMLSGHKGAIDTFENEIEHGNSPAIKDYAETVLPVIQDHVRIAEDVAGTMGMSGKQGLNQENKAIVSAALNKTHGSGPA